jgi:transposase InsO family protein
VSCETSWGKATVKELCETFHVSRQAYYVARQPKRERVAPAPRPERTGEWATYAELVPAIRAIVDEHRAWGVRKVWATLRRRGLTVSRKRVWSIMHELNLVLAPVEQREETRRGQVTVPFSDRRWATDLTTVHTRVDGVVAIVPLIDCGDRFMLGVHVTKSQEAPAVLAPLSQALLERFETAANVPDGLEVRTDHGPQYTSSTCDDLCRAWGLEHTFAPVGRPTGNAVAERVILTLKSELIWLRDWESAEELREAIERWRIFYNTERPHQALAWATPAERRAANRALLAAVAA